MSFKKVSTILPTIVISAITSLLVSSLFALVCFRLFVPSVKESTAKIPASTVSPAGSPNTPSEDTQFAKYESIINDFLNTLRKGDIEAAYKSTSPVFQKKTSLDNFKKMLTGLQSGRNIPTSACSLTEYSEPFSSNIEGLSDKYTIVQTKCEATEDNEIKGFNVEFIDDGGQAKISYLNVYKSLVTHKK